MGMTIEAQIKAFEYFKKCGIFPFSDTRTRIVFIDECINGAIKTMCKYQMIVPALAEYDLLNPIADVKTIEGEGIYIHLSDLQDYIQKVVEDIDNAPTVEAIPKADYENRLKADVVAMLEELSLEIDEMDCTIDHDFEGYYTGHVDCQKLIREKIDALKGEKNERGTQETT